MAGARGRYAKGAAKREEILDTALRIIAANGYTGATVKELAESVGLSQNGLLHYFGSKDALFTEVLRRRDADDDARARAEARTTAELAAGIAAEARRNAELPGFIQLYARLSNEATEIDHSSHDYFRSRYERVREDGRAVVERMQRDGLIRPDVDPALLAASLFAMIDGLQTQWMYDRSIDVAEHVLHILGALAPSPEKPR